MLNVIEREKTVANFISEQLTYNGIEYTLIREKIKNTYIQIKNGKVIVKAPIKAKNNYIENLLENKANWIYKKQQEQASLMNTKFNYQDGDKISVLGKFYTLKIIYKDNGRNKIYKDLQNIYCELNSEIKNSSKDIQIFAVKKLIEKYYKNIAQEEVKSAMEYLQEKTGLYPLEVKIKKLKATWGICSSKRKISINSNLMAYSRQAIEYVCLHELCHLKYMNHSKKFWNLVEYYMPDYKLAKKELRREI